MQSGNSHPLLLVQKNKDQEENRLTEQLISRIMDGHYGTFLSLEINCY